MEKTFTVDLCSNIVFGKKNDLFSECKGSMTDLEIHTFIFEKLHINEWNKLVILFHPENTTTALRIALHVRLTEAFGQRKFCPIIVASTIGLDGILRLGKEYSSILLSKGIKFLLNPSENDILLEISHLTSLNNQDYQGDFLQKIILHSAGGRHSMANLWGAKILDEVAGTNVLTGQYSSDELISSLYYKFMREKSSKNVNTEVASLRKIDARGKKIILIDDEAEKGWELVLRSIFTLDYYEDFVVVNQIVKNYEQFDPENKKIIESCIFDIYLIDLRLGGEDEDEKQLPSLFSGLTVLKKVKEINRGNQVIIFTASNKAWSYKTMLNEGASGYYVKESPELGLPFDFSASAYKDFISTCKFCFDEGFLRKVADNVKQIKKTIENEDWELPEEFYNSYNGQFENYPESHLKIISKELDIFFDLLASRNENRFNHSMLMMVKVLEEFNRIYFSTPPKGKYATFKDGGYLGYMRGSQWIEFNQHKNDVNVEIVNSSKNLVHNILDRSRYSRKPLYEIIEQLFEKRNHYIHPKKKIISVSKEEILSWSNGLKEIFAYVKKNPFSS